MDVENYSDYSIVIGLYYKKKNSIDSAQHCFEEHFSTSKRHSVILIA